MAESLVMFAKGQMVEKLNIPQYHRTAEQHKNKDKGDEMT